MLFTQSLSLSVQSCLSIKYFLQPENVSHDTKGILKYSPDLDELSFHSEGEAFLLLQTIDEGSTCEIHLPTPINILYCKFKSIFVSL